jgi:hypothetical protein
MARRRISNFCHTRGPRPHLETITSSIYMYKYTYTRADIAAGQVASPQKRTIHFCGDIVVEEALAPAPAEMHCYQIIRGSWPTFIVKVMPDGYVPPRIIHTVTVPYVKHSDAAEQLGEFTRTITKIQSQPQPDCYEQSGQSRRQEAHRHPQKKQPSAEHRYHRDSRVSGHHSQQRRKNESRP